MRDQDQKKKKFPCRENLRSTVRARWIANIERRVAAVLRRDLAIVILAGDHRILGKTQ